MKEFERTRLTIFTALEINDSELIQNLLEKFDKSINRLVTMRTRVGYIINSVESFRTKIEKENIDDAQHRSKLVDADVAELFSDISKQQDLYKYLYEYK